MVSSCRACLTMLLVFRRYRGDVLGICDIGSEGQGSKCSDERFLVSLRNHPASSGINPPGIVLRHPLVIIALHVETVLH
jgi:hypothetical protein